MNCKRHLRPPIWRHVFWAGLAAIALVPVAASGQEIRIGGTGNALGTMQLLGGAFAQANPAIKVSVMPSMGTAGAIKAVPKGAIALGLSSRPLSEEESRLGLTAVEYAQSPTVFAVVKSSKIAAVTTKQLVDIYAGKLAAWPDGSPVRPILRQPGDDNTRQIKALSADMEAAVSSADKRAGLVFAVTDQEAAEKIETIPGGLGVSTLALMLSEKRNLRALALDGVELVLKNLANGRYPLVKKFYMILPASPSADVQAFVKFVKSPAGAEILKQNGQIAR